MKKLKILIYTILASIIVVGLVFTAVNANVTATNAEIAANPYDNHLLDAMEYLGVNISWLRDNNLLLTNASRTGAYRKAGGAGGSVPGYDLIYPENVSLHYPYPLNNEGKIDPKHYPTSCLSNYNYNAQRKYTDVKEIMGYKKAAYGIETYEGEPYLHMFKNLGWVCDSFPTYYYLNYLPNVVGLGKGNSDMDKDFNKIIKKLKSIHSSPYYYFQYVVGWEAALMDLEEKTDLVEMYSKYVWVPSLGYKRNKCK